MNFDDLVFEVHRIQGEWWIVRLWNRKYNWRQREYGTLGARFRKTIDVYEHLQKVHEEYPELATLDVIVKDGKISQRIDLQDDVQKVSLVLTYG